MSVAIALLPIDFRPLERFDRGTIGQVVAPTEAREFVSAAGAHGVDQPRVAVVDEVLEWISLTVLLSHEDEWYIRRGDEQRGGESRARRVDQRAQSLASRAVADLIVVLCRHDE